MPGKMRELRPVNLHPNHAVRIKIRGADEKVTGSLCISVTSEGQVFITGPTETSKKIFQIIDGELKETSLGLASEIGDLPPDPVEQPRRQAFAFATA